MKKVFALILALLIAAVLLVACNQIKSGEVYDKYYTPAHSESYTTYESVYDDGKYWNSRLAPGMNAAYPLANCSQD